MAFIKLVLIYSVVLMNSWSTHSSVAFPAPNSSANRILGFILAYNMDHMDPLMLIFNEYTAMCESGWRPTLIIFTTVPWSNSIRKYIKTKTFCHTTNASLPILFDVYAPIVTTSLAAVHRQVLGERVSDYDMFIYHEDDVIFKHTHLAAYIEETKKIHSLFPQHGLWDYNIGFQRYRSLSHDDETQNGHITEEEVLDHDLLEELPNFIPVCLEQHPYIKVKGNTHQAIWALTRDQVLLLQQKCNFMNQTSPSREHMSSLSLFERKGGYCGMEKILPPSGLAKFAIQHYYGRSPHRVPVFLAHENLLAGYALDSRDPKDPLEGLPACWAALVNQSRFHQSESLVAEHIGGTNMVSTEDCDEYDDKEEEEEEGGGKHRKSALRHSHSHGHDHDNTNAFGQIDKSFDPEAPHSSQTQTQIQTHLRTRYDSPKGRNAGDTIDPVKGDNARNTLPSPYSPHNKIMAIILTVNYDHITSLLMILDAYVSMCEGGWAPFLVILSIYPHWGVSVRRLLRSKAFCYRTNSTVPIRFHIHNGNMTSINALNAHRAIVGENLGNFDVFVYQEDDMVLTHSQFVTYLHETQMLYSLVPAKAHSEYVIDFLPYQRKRRPRDLHHVPWSEADALEQDVVEYDPSRGLHIGRTCVQHSPYFHLAGNAHPRQAQPVWVYTQDQVMVLDEKCGFLNQGNKTLRDRLTGTNTSSKPSPLHNKRMRDTCGLSKIIPATGLDAFAIYHYYPTNASAVPTAHQWSLFTLNEKLLHNKNINSTSDNNLGINKTFVHSLPPCWAPLIKLVHEEAIEKALESYPTHSPVAPPDEGSLIKGGDRQVYLVQEGVLRAVPDADTLYAMGFDFDNVKVVSGIQLAKYRFGEPLPSALAPPAPVSNPEDGSLVLGGGTIVYLVRDGLLHAIPDVKTFVALGFEFDNVKHLPAADVAQMQVGDPLPPVLDPS